MVRTWFPGGWENPQNQTKNQNPLFLFNCKHDLKNIWIWNLKNTFNNTCYLAFDKITRKWGREDEKVSYKY